MKVIIGLNKKILKMNWTTLNKANKTISNYDHIICDIPLGKCVIEWKSWKDNPSYDISVNGEWIAVEYDLETAKEKTRNYVITKYNELKLFIGE
jgi:hypothetical protein